MKYRKKPVEVDAYQITKEMIDEHLLDDKPLPKGLRTRSARVYPDERKTVIWHGTVVTIHGQETIVVIDDWIIAEPDGTHHYPCKPDIFEKTYERVDE